MKNKIKIVGINEEDFILNKQIGNEIFGRQIFDRTFPFIKEDGSKKPAFYSSENIEIVMPEMINEELIPLSIAEIMEQRVIAFNSNNNNLKSFWNSNYFKGGDTIMYNHNYGRHPQKEIYGEIKIVLDSETLRLVNKNSIRAKDGFGAVALPHNTFSETKGYIFKKKEVEKYANRNLNLNEVLENPIWIALARGDKHLLEEYTKLHLKMSKSDKSMKIGIDEKGLDFLTETPISISSLLDSNYEQLYCSNNTSSSSWIGIPKPKRKSENLISRLKKVFN